MAPSHNTFPIQSQVATGVASGNVNESHLPGLFSAGFHPLRTRTLEVVILAITTTPMFGMQEVHMFKKFYKVKSVSGFQTADLNGHAASDSNRNKSIIRTLRLSANDPE